MLDGMINIMARINELKSRFRLNEPSLPGRGSGQNGEFQALLENSSATGNMHFLHNDRAVSRDEIEKIISFYSEEKKVPADLVRALVQKGSGYNSEAVSSEGALGLMQLMPSVADRLGITDPFNPEENLKGGIALLGDLLRENRGDYKNAIEAYNSARKAGEGNDLKVKKDEFSKSVIDIYVRGGE